MTQAQQTLQMKTYFSSTVEAAVDLARRELGPEAMLVNSRASPEDVRHLGRYEVIFATGVDATPQPPTRAVEPFLPIKGAKKPPASAANTDTHLQLEDIRLQLTTIRQTLWSSRSNSEPLGGPSEASILRRSLEANGVESRLARELIHSVVRQNPGQAGPEQLRYALAVEMESRLQVDPALQSIAAFVGPPGRGKSTMLVKLAIDQGLSRRAAVRIISMDNYRVGSHEQMRSYGAILGVAHHSCDTIGELDYQLNNTWGTDAHKLRITLIDTSGYGPADLEEAAELAAYLSARPEIGVHLVLRADTKSADGVSTLRRYSQFGVSQLIFTGLDEAETFGSLYNIAVLTGKPISYLGTGQRIPEDLEPAMKSRLIQLVMQGRDGVDSAAA